MQREDPQDKQQQKPRPTRQDLKRMLGIELIEAARELRDERQLQRADDENTLLSLFIVR